MANKVTGSTDTTGALTINQRSARSLLLVGQSKAPDVVKEEMFNIFSTMEAITYFGEDHPFALIAKVLIQNGVDFIRGICVNIDEVGTDKKYKTIDEAYEGAFEVSLGDSSVKVVLIDVLGDDPDKAAINTKLKQHLNIAESNDIFRYAVIGGQKGITDAELIDLAETVADKRMFVVGPNVVNGQNEEYDGIYTAAGLGAVMITETATDPALPMNDVGIVGFSGVCRKLLFKERENMRIGGVTPLYPEAGTPLVHRLVTSYTTDEIWKEGTTVMIADDVLDSVEKRLRTNYKRTKNVTRILNAIRTDVISVLEIKEGLEIIQNLDKTTVTVTKDPEDLYGALVDYEFQVVTPLYTITIRQHMKL